MHTLMPGSQPTLTAGALRVGFVRALRFGGRLANGVLDRIALPLIEVPMPLDSGADAHPPAAPTRGSPAGRPRT